MLILLPSVITHSHNISLAMAAIVVSIVAAITGLALMNNIRTLPDSRRKAIIVMAAFLLGGGIWSMHFLAMLSIQFTVPIHYDLLQTLSSGLIAVLVVGVALLLLHFRERTPFVLNCAGIFLGLGVVSMHVVGMLGMRGVIPVFNPTALSIAVVLALAMGIAAIRVSYGSRSRQNIIKGGVLFGLTVVVVHYTAMIGTHFSIDPDYQALTIALNQGALAIAVTVTAFVICGTFLLAASTFGPSARYNDEVMAHSAVDHVGQPLAPQKEGVAVESNVAGPAEHSKSAVNGAISEDLEKSRSDFTLVKSGNSSDANGHSTLENSSVQLPQNLSDSANEQPMAQVLTVSNALFLPIKIPYEQQKQIFFIDSDQVGAIRADGRYSQLYTREGVKFCPWSITEAEKRLAGVRFFRSHRSYLINVSAVASFEKNRDSGVCRFEGFTHLANVPVSRARVSDLVAELGL